MGVFIFFPDFLGSARPENGHVAEPGFRRKDLSVA